MRQFSISLPNDSIVSDLQQKIDTKTKPLGALGKLEAIALQVGLIQQTLEPTIGKPAVVVFAGDHGITSEGVSAYPREVTGQMVLNFLSGGAAINVLASQHQLALTVVNAGVDHAFEPNPQLVDVPMAKGTKNFLHEPAMSREQCSEAIERGSDIVRKLHREGTNVVAFGEMGIGNTSAAAMIMHALCDLPLKDCVGRGTGLDDAQYAAKLASLEQARKHHGDIKDPLDVLATYGGFEIAMMTGAYLQAAELGMVILVDGFIATSALLVAHRLAPPILAYCIFSHQSDEQGHRLMLESLGAQPLLKLSLRLGEGTGAAVAFPLVASSVALLNTMASFESAHVAQKI